MRARSSSILARGLTALFLSPAWLALAGNPATPAWPPPPAQPYIVYQGSIYRPADIGVKPPALRRFVNWLAGAGQHDQDLARPFGLALDQAGDLLVTDTAARTVCCLELARKRWLHWNHIGHTQFAMPVAVARHGNTFFVADSGLGKVIAFDQKGRLQFEITDPLQRPAGLAILGDRLFIVDSQRHQVVVCNLRGQLLSQFGRRGGGSGEFNFPTHISADSSGHLYVTDALNYRVQVFDANGHFQRMLGSAGDTPGHFSRPKGVVADAAGHIYVVDALMDNVQIFNDAGRLLLNWGESGSAPGQFWLPNAIVINPQNEIFVADSFNHRIQIFKYTGRR